MNPENVKLLFVIIHLFGVAVGAGGAFASDSAFLTSLGDKKISKDEFRMLKAFSRLVWIGTALLLISGAGLFALNPVALSASSKFLVKMSVVGVILLNGVVFHIMHLPFLERNLGKPLSSRHTPNGMPEIPFVLVSGVISMTSWASAILLGTLRSIPLSYFGGLTIYALLIGLGIFSALFMFALHLTKENREKIRNAGLMALGVSALLLFVAFATGGFFI